MNLSRIGFGTPLLLQLVAAICYAIGGGFMKASEGMTKRLPSFAIFVFFFAGATLQTLSMRSTNMGSAYVAVLGLEAVAALMLSLLYFQEGFALRDGFAVILILAGVLLLRR